jgi:hypothetical protein
VCVALPLRGPDSALERLAGLLVVLGGLDSHGMLLPWWAIVAVCLSSACLFIRHCIHDNNIVLNTMSDKKTRDSFTYH